VELGVVEDGLQTLPDPVAGLGHALAQIGQRAEQVGRLDSVDRRVPDGRRQVQLKAGDPLGRVLGRALRLDHIGVVAPGDPGQRGALARLVGLLDLLGFAAGTPALVAFIDRVDAAL
jgi:hypothetical protein